MYRVFANANYEFLRARNVAYKITLALIIPGLVLLAVRGMNESIDFTGGTLIQIQAQNPEVNTGTIRTALTDAGITGAEIQRFGGPTEFVVRAARVGEETSIEEVGAAVSAALTQAFGEGGFTVERTEAVSAKVGQELKTKALLAIFMSFGATMIYLWIRFEWRFGLAAIITTVHDIAATLAFISVFNLEVTLVIVAAVLTIVGYSLNDTIVVFDRVRENLKKYRRANIYDILNRSVNETLPRTVLTGVTTLSATLALLIFGSAIIQGFAAVMSFGIIIGTFSSIYIAAPILLLIEQRWPGADVKGARTITQARPEPAPR